MKGLCDLKAVFLDLDGSMLNSQRQIGEEDRRTVARLREAGVRVHIATGRHYRLAARYHRELGLELPFLASDGAVLYHPGQRQVVFAHPMPAEVIRDILRAAAGEEFYFHDVADAYFSPNFGRMGVWQDYAAGCGPQDLCSALSGPPEGYLAGEPVMMAIMLHLPSPGLLAELKEICRGKVPLYIHPEERIAIASAPGWDKGRGAAWLAEAEGFSLRDTLALGDAGNDLPLLRAVGWPVVPQNGEEEAKALARFITTDHDNNPLTAAIEALFPELLR